MNYSSRIRISVASVTRIASSLAVVALAAAVVTPAAAQRPKMQIKFATVAPEGTTWMNIMHELDEELRAATENRLGFKFYPGAVQGDEKDVLRKMRNGQIHAGGFSGFGLGAIASEFRAIEVPFMFRTLDEVDYTRDALDPYYRDLFAEKGYYFLGWADVGFVYLYSNQPIRNPDELRAAKVWTWSGDKLAELFFQAFDVSPIPLALPDVLTSLQMGVVDAVYSPPLACIALQWFTRVNYMSDVPLTHGFGALLLSKRAVKNVSAADLAVLKELSEKHSRRLIEKTRKENIDAIDVMQEEGVQLIEIDEATTNAFFATGRSAWKDGVGELYPAELLERVSTTVETYRARKAEAKN